MFEFAKRGLYVGLGLANMTKEKVESFAQEFAKQAKLSEEEGKKFAEYLQAESKKASAELKQNVDKLVEAAVNKLGEVALYMGKAAMSPQVLSAFAFAHPFQDVCGDVILAWQLLWRATVAAGALEKGARKKDTAFYEGQLKTAEFFIHSILPITLGKMEAILATNSAVVEIDEAGFGG